MRNANGTMTVSRTWQLASLQGVDFTAIDMLQHEDTQ